MTEDWRGPFDLARDRFIEALIRRGFRERSDAWIGEISGPEGEPSTTVRLTLPSAFPFRPPSVWIEGASPRTLEWHVSNDGSLCLWNLETGTSAPMPWCDVDVFLDRVREWLRSRSAGWPQGPIDLDLERYFSDSIEKDLILYDEAELRSLIDKPVVYVEKEVGRTHPTWAKAYLARRQLTYCMKEAKSLPKPGRKRAGRRRDIYGVVADVGQIQRPIRDWADLKPLLPEWTAKAIEKCPPVIVGLLYRRGQHTGTVFVGVEPRVRGHTGDLVLRAIKSARVDAAGRALRMGRALPGVDARRVAVVGLGAVGSYVAEMLVRSGVRKIHLVDGDLVLPGNVVRHSARSDQVGEAKVIAVGQNLLGLDVLDPQSLTVSQTFATEPGVVTQLLTDYDLVVDTTASPGFTTMCQRLAEGLNRSMISACVQQEGRIVRVDRWPLRQGESHSPAPALVAPDPTQVEVLDSGCGHPLSMTPPYAVVAAASLCCQVALDLLSGSCGLPPTVSWDIVIPRPPVSS